MGSACFGAVYARERTLEGKTLPTGTRAGAGGRLPRRQASMAAMTERGRG